jgi:hypothetical protein
VRPALVRRGQRDDLRGRGVRRVEIELQLSLVLRRQRAQRVLQRDAPLELRGQLLDRRDFGKGERAVAARGRGPDEPPFLQVTEMVLGDARIESANVPDAQRHSRVTLEHGGSKVKLDLEMWNLEMWKSEISKFPNFQISR